MGKNTRKKKKKMLLRKGTAADHDGPSAKRARQSVRGETLEEAVFGHGSGLDALGVPLHTLGVRYAGAFAFLLFAVESTCHRQFLARGKRSNA